MRTVNLLSGIACVSVPVGYLVKKHVDWERSPQSKKRMLVHQGTFWGTMTLALVMMHKAFRRTTPLIEKLALYISASVLPILGFEWGGHLGRTLYPYQPKPSAPPQPMKRYVPSYLVSA